MVQKNRIDASIRQFFEEIGELLRPLCNVFLRQVGVNFVYSSGIRPSADLLHDLGWDLQMVCKRCKTVPQTVVANLRKTVFSANSVDLVIYIVPGQLYNIIICQLDRQQRFT
jgi:hypothetical protein